MAQEQDPERENEKDTECSREKAERVQSFPRSTQVVQVHDSKMGNEKDAECSKEIAEQVPFPDCSREEKIDNNGFEPVSCRDTDDRKEV